MLRLFLLLFCPSPVVVPLHDESYVSNETGRCMGAFNKVTPCLLSSVPTHVVGILELQVFESATEINGNGSRFSRTLIPP